MAPTSRTREHTLRRLRDGYACGHLGTTTLSRRVDVALRATSSEELRGLTADFAADGGWWRRMGRSVQERLGPAPASLGILEAARLSTTGLTFGRSPQCAVVLDDDAVSRRHASLRLGDGRWYLLDHDSSNGTWVNGRRVFNAEVVAGDEIQMGEVRFRL